MQRRRTPVHHSRLPSFHSSTLSLSQLSLSWVTPLGSPLLSSTEVEVYLQRNIDEEKLTYFSLVCDFDSDVQMGLNLNESLFTKSCLLGRQAMPFCVWVLDKRSITEQVKHNSLSTGFHHILQVLQSSSKVNQDYADWMDWKVCRAIYRRRRVFGKYCVFIHIGGKYVSQPILLIENFPQIDRKVKGVLGKGKIWLYSSNLHPCRWFYS